MTLTKINKLIKEYIIELNPDETDFNFISSLVDIVINTRSKATRQTYRSVYRLSDSLISSKKFLSSLDPSYGDLLLKLLKSEELELVKVTGRNNYIASSTLTESGTHHIFLPYNETIEDSYTIVHEVLHDSNVSLELTESRFLFTEAISILGEMLFEDYYSSTKPKEYLKNGKDLLYAILNKAVSLHIQIELIKLFLKYGEVNKSNIKEIGVTDSLKPFINMYLNYYSKLDELPFDNDQRHLMGFLFASYMHDSGDGANYLRDINRVINDVSFDDILSSIGIHTTNSDGYDLDIASKKVLKKIYERAVIKYE